jgi:hypothetical protein
MSWSADSVGGQRASKRKQEESSGAANANAHPAGNRKYSTGLAFLKKVLGWSPWVVMSTALTFPDGGVRLGHERFPVRGEAGTGGMAAYHQPFARQ